AAESRPPVSDGDRRRKPPPRCGTSAPPTASAQRGRPGPEKGRSAGAWPGPVPAPGLHLEGRGTAPWPDFTATKQRKPTPAPGKRASVLAGFHGEKGALQSSRIKPSPDRGVVDVLSPSTRNDPASSTAPTCNSTCGLMGVLPSLLWG